MTEEKVEEIIKGLDKPKYTQVRIKETLDGIQKVLDLKEKQKHNLLQLREQMIRISRGIKPTFWLDDLSWKKLTLKEKTQLIRNEKCVRFQTSGSIFQDVKDFPFFAKKQWEKDRKKLLEDGEIN